MSEINIRPITISWTEWVTRSRETDDYPKKFKDSLKAGNPKPLIEAVGEWQQRCIAWYKGLTPAQQQDLIDLASAEIDLLWNVADPAAHAPSGYFPDKPGDFERLDFRTRYRELAPLLPIIREARNQGVEHISESSAILQKRLIDLEQWVMGHRETWLP